MNTWLTARREIEAILNKQHELFTQTKRYRDQSVEADEQYFIADYPCIPSFYYSCLL